MRTSLHLTPGVTPKSFQALRKSARGLLFAALFFAAGNLLPAQEAAQSAARRASAPAGAESLIWYRSNSSGMTLEQIPSRAAALRNEYCLSAGSAAYRELPELLLPYYANSYRIELRVLYHEGNEIRRQWIFRGAREVARINASGSGPLFAERNSERETDREESSSGFIEIRNSDGVILTEFQFDADSSEWEYRYFYREGVLTRSEVWRKEAALQEQPPETPPSETPSLPPPPPIAGEAAALVSTDFYRYTRSGSLRAVDRTLHAGAAEKLRAGFPRLGPGTIPADAAVTPESAYTHEFPAGANPQKDAEVNYKLDNRGRVLSEVWKDEEGNVLGEVTNIWSGDRLTSTLWKSDDDERLVEFDYDSSGERVAERNYRRGVLERSVTNQDGTEIEEIYMNGKIILRAFWENGIKVSEERVLPGRDNQR